MALPYPSISIGSKDFPKLSTRYMDTWWQFDQGSKPLSPDESASGPVAILGPATRVDAPGKPGAVLGPSTRTYSSWLGPDLESTGRVPGVPLAGMGPEATIPYEKARRDLRRVLAEMQFARTRAAAQARQQIGRVLEDLPWTLMNIEGEEAAYGMSRSGQLYMKLALARQAALRTIYDILTRLADYLGETYQQGITSRFGLQDTGTTALFGAYDARAKALQSIFR